MGSFNVIHMMSSSKEVEFDVLGLRVKSRPENEDGIINTKDVVDFVSHEALKIRSAAPQLDNGKVAVLLALELAKQNLKMKSELKTTVNSIHERSQKAYNLLEEIIPTSL